MEFSRQEYWRGLPFPSLGDLPHPGISRRPFISCIANGFFPAEPLGKPPPRQQPLGCEGAVWVHGSSPSFAATQVLFTAHLLMSPGDRAQQDSPLPQEGRGGRSEKTAMCPKTSAHPLQSRGPGAGLRAWYSLSVAASGGKGLGGPWDFRTPREGLDPLEIQLPPTPHPRDEA